MDFKSEHSKKATEDARHPRFAEARNPSIA
jgi:hypothetical protein